MPASFKLPEESGLRKPRSFFRGRVLLPPGGFANPTVRRSASINSVAAAARRSDMVRPSRYNAGMVRLDYLLLAASVACILSAFVFATQHL